MEIFKIIGIAFITAICTLIVKATKPELSFAITTIGVVVIVLQIFNSIPQISNFFHQVSEISGIENNIVKLLLKIVAIGYVTEFSSDLLVDFGSASLADKVILAGKITIIVLSLPVFESLLKLIQGFLNA